MKRISNFDLEENLKKININFFLDNGKVILEELLDFRKNYVKNVIEIKDNIISGPPDVVDWCISIGSAIGLSGLKEVIRWDDKKKKEAKLKG